MYPIKVTKTATLKGHTGSVYALANDASGNFFYSGCGNGMVIRWNVGNLPDGTLSARIQGNIFSLHALEESSLLLIGQMQGGIHVIDLQEKKELRHLAYHQKGVYDIQRNSERNRIFSAGGDGKISVINPTDFSLTTFLQLSPKSVRQVAFHPKGKIFAAGCSDNIVYIIEEESLKTIHVLPEHGNSVFSVCFSPDGKYLLSGSRDAQLRVWNAQESFRLMHKIPAHLSTINSIVYSPDSKYFATASRDKTIKIWDAESFVLLKVIDKEKLDGHINSVNKLLWLTSGNLVSCGDDRSVMVWQVGASG